MEARIVQSTEIITLVGAGALSAEALAACRAVGPRVVAADGGAAAALAHGLLPEAVIGDLDSLDAPTRAAIPPARLHPAPDQDRTDFDKALGAIEAPLVLAVGFTGGRLDHELAVYNALVRADRPAIVVGAEDLCFHLAAPVTLALPVGTRVSLFPMAEVGCASEGLRWPTDHLTFSPGGRVGTSNEAAAARVSLVPRGAGMLVILPRGCLEAAIRALTGPPRARGG